MFAMKATEVGNPFHKISQVTYTNTGDFLMIVCAKNYWYCATFLSYFKI